MDCNYALSSIRNTLHAGTSEKGLPAVARPSYEDKRVDAAMSATILFKDLNGRIVQCKLDVARPSISGVIEVGTDKAIIYFYDAMIPRCTITYPSQTKLPAKRYIKSSTLVG